MVAPTQVSSIQVAPIRLDDKKNIEASNRKKQSSFSWGWQTPSVETGYQGIAKKAIGNATLSMLAIVEPPFYVIRSGVGFLGETVMAALLMTGGALGLLATPAILAKDLTHHTWRVLSQKL